MLTRVIVASIVIGLPVAVPSVVLAQGAGGGVVSAAESRLTIGDAAPALSIGEWVQGGPVTGFEKGKVYVVEFWATWCGPCMREVPHLTKLHEMYSPKGVTFIGATRPDTKGNTLEKVREVVGKKTADGLMTYPIAWDDQGKTYEVFMIGSRRTGIPCAFIVDQESKIAFIGHPSGIDQPLEQVVAGSWNSSAFKDVYEKEMAANLAYNEFFIFLRAGRLDEAYERGAKLVEVDRKDDAAALNGIAWKIVDPKETHARRDTKLALRAAKRAAELTNHQDVGILDTLARAYFADGDVASAIKFQTEAVRLSKSAEEKADMQAVLDEYEAASR